MNYDLIYKQIIQNAVNLNRTKKSGYFECHHILPKCLGGSDVTDNLVLLTPREHFIVHLLLWKNNKNNYKLFAPLLYFKKNKHVKNARTFEYIRIQHIRFMKENNPSLYLSDESKKRKSNKISEYSKNRTQEHRDNISASNKGKQKRLAAKLEESSKEKISESLKEYFKLNGMSDKAKENLSKALTGYKHTNKSKEIWKLAAKNRKKYECPICKKNNLDGGNLNQHMKTRHLWTSEKCNEFKNTVGPVGLNS